MSKKKLLDLKVGDSVTFGDTEWTITELGEGTRHYEQEVAPMLVFRLANDAGETADARLCW